MYFSNLKELVAAINKWVKMSVDWDIMATLKKQDKSKKGFVKLKEFYKVLEDGGIKLKSNDKKLIDNND